MFTKKQSISSTSEKTKGTFNKLINYGILIVLLLLCLSLVRSINRTRMALTQISDVQKRVDDLKQQNLDMEKRLQEENTAEFMEKQLRDKLNMVKTGEIVVILPDPEIVRKYAPKVEEKEIALPDPNWKKWMKTFGL
jgi:cell division protein FtsB